MSTVWVTGAKGFIGRHLAIRLEQAGCTVGGIGHGAFPPEIARQSGLSQWINGDIGAHNLQQLLKLTGPPDTIYHLAGGSSVGLSLQTPVEDFQRSVVSTSALLEWIRNAVPDVRLVVSSSAAVYGDTGLDRIPEIGPFTPYSPYGFHKRSAELMCESYAQTFGLKVAVVRLFSVYGPGLCKQLIWDLCNRLQHEPPRLEMQGTGDEIRDWLYVEDAVTLLVAASKIASAPLALVNGGTGLGTCVRDVVQILCDILEQSPDIEFSGRTRPGDPFSLVADTTRLQQTFGLSLEHSLRLGLTEYVNWFKQFHIN